MGWFQSQGVDGEAKRMNHSVLSLICVNKKKQKMMPHFWFYFCLLRREHAPGLISKDGGTHARMKKSLYWGSRLLGMGCRRRAQEETRKGGCSTGPVQRKQIRHYPVLLLKEVVDKRMQTKPVHSIVLIARIYCFG